MLDQGGPVVEFNISGTTKMENVFAAYCIKMAVDGREIRFVYRGNQFPGVKTADELGIEDGDVINAMLHQIGD